MNSVILSGRLTADPKIGEKSARYTLAVDRIGEGADFINCVCFGKSIDFAKNYLHKGMKILVSGKISTGSYTNNDGNKVYTTDVIVFNHEFCEKKTEAKENVENVGSVDDDEFINIPDTIEDLPFN